MNTSSASIGGTAVNRGDQEGGDPPNERRAVQVDGRRDGPPGGAEPEPVRLYADDPPEDETQRRRREERQRQHDEARHQQDKLDNAQRRAERRRADDESAERRRARQRADEEVRAAARRFPDDGGAELEPGEILEDSETSGLGRGNEEDGGHVDRRRAKAERMMVIGRFMHATERMTDLVRRQQAGRRVASTPPASRAANAGGEPTSETVRDGGLVPRPSDVPEMDSLVGMVDRMARRANIYTPGPNTPGVDDMYWDHLRMGFTPRLARARDEEWDEFANTLGAVRVEPTPRPAPARPTPTHTVLVETHRTASGGEPSDNRGRERPAAVQQIRAAATNVGERVVSEAPGGVAAPGRGRNHVDQRAQRRQEAVVEDQRVQRGQEDTTRVQRAQRGQEDGRRERHGEREHRRPIGNEGNQGEEEREGAQAGVPRSIVSDRGSHFTAALWRGAMQRLGADHKMTPAYHPAANGLIERWHREIKRSITARLEEHGGDWLSHLPAALLHLRTAIRNDTGASPAQITLGADLRIPGAMVEDERGDGAIAPDVGAGAAGAKSVWFDLSVPPFAAHRYDRPSGRRLNFSSGRAYVKKAVKTGLTPPYQGPFPIVQETDTAIAVERAGGTRWYPRSVMKPANIAETPDAGARLNGGGNKDASHAAPAGGSASGGETGQAADQDTEQSQPLLTTTATATPRFTRSGRKIRTPQRFSPGQ